MRVTTAKSSLSLRAITVKDRLGDQRGGSEWEPIKILLEGRSRPMSQIHNQGLPHEFAKVA
jgi:hypothetical protein